MSVEAEKVCYSCCRQGAICLRIQMEKNTFTPGESIAFTTDINNQTSKCIRTVIFTLYAHVQYKGFMPKGKQRSRLDSSEVVRQEANTQIAPFNTTKITNTFSLPHVLPVSSDSRDSELMSTRYELVGTIHLPCSLASVKARLPITITCTPRDTDTCPLLQGAVLSGSQGHQN